MATQPVRGRSGTGKSAQAFRTISEVSEDLDLPQHVLRFWETRFAQVKPMKRNGGRRLYRPDNVALLRGIKALLYDDGMTIKGVQKILREKGIKAVMARGKEGPFALTAAQALVPGDVTDRLAALRARLDEHLPRTSGADGTPEVRVDPANAARMRESIDRLEALLTQLEAK